MGHEVMALFNSQLNPSHDHALRAVMAALEVRDAFLQLYEELGIAPDPHYYRIGINTGIATLGNVGSVSRREFTAIGDTINTAKRIEENASYGQVLISESARAHILKTNGGSPPDLRFGERLELTAKGKATILVVYEVFRN
jgi:class 3 adenylate cyclase